MRKISKWVKDTYNNPEIIITENGYSDAGGILNDDRRINYIRVSSRKIINFKKIHSFPNRNI